MSQRIYLFFKFALFAFLLTATTQTIAAAKPKVYVSNSKDHTVSVIDTSNSNVVNTITLLPGLEGMAITPDSKYVYIANSGTTKVTAIETDNDKVIANIEVGAKPVGLSLSKDGKLLLVATKGADALVYVNTQTNQVVDKVKVPSVYNVALNATDTLAVAASQRANNYALIIIDVRKKKIVNKVPLSHAPIDLRFGPDNHSLYFTQEGVDAISVLDTETNKIVNLIPTGPAPFDITFTHDGKLGLVASQDSGNIYLFDPRTNRVIDSIKIGKKPHSMAVSSDDKFVYATDEAADSVLVVDLLNKRVLNSILVGHKPRKIVLQAGDIEAQAAYATKKEGKSAIIVTYEFAPEEIRIKQGETVTWRNKDLFTHKLESENHVIASVELAPGAHYSLRFEKPGTYDYTCGIHDDAMGKVIVQ